MLTLRKISKENRELVRQLTVRPDQQRFIAPVEKTLADAAAWPDSRFRVACNHDIPVGLVLVYPFSEGNVSIVNIVRFMIDASHQGRGLGWETLAATLKWIQGFRPEIEEVRISTHPENSVALNLYEGMGFRRVAVVEGEQVLSISAYG